MQNHERALGYKRSRF